MDKQKKSETRQTSMDIDEKVLKEKEQEMIELECPTDSEEPLEVAIEYDLKL